MARIACSAFIPEILFMKALTVLLASLVCLPVPCASAQDIAIEKIGSIPLDLGEEFAGQIVDLFKNTDGHYFLTD